MGRWTYSYRRKWRLIAIAVFTLLMIQFLLAYNFYSANHDEEDRIEIWQRRVEALEIAQQNHIKSANENVKHENVCRIGIFIQHNMCHFNVKAIYENRNSMNSHIF